MEKFCKFFPSFSFFPMYSRVAYQWRQAAFYKKKNAILFSANRVSFISRLYFWDNRLIFVKIKIAVAFVSIEFFLRIPRRRYSSNQLSSHNTKMKQICFVFCHFSLKYKKTWKFYYVNFTVFRRFSWKMVKI